MAVQTTTPPPQQFQPLPAKEHHRPITHRPETAPGGFEQVRRQTGAPVAGHGEPLAAATVLPPPPGVVRTAGRPEAAQARPPVGPVAQQPEAGRPPVAAATPRGGGFVPRPEALGQVRELLQQAAGRTHLQQEAHAGRNPLPGVQRNPLPRPVPPQREPLVATPTPRPAPAEAPRTPLVNLGPQIAQAQAATQSQASSVQDRAARTEGAPGVAPHQRVLIDQLI